MKVWIYLLRAAYERKISRKKPRRNNIQHHFRLSKGRGHSKKWRLMI